MQKLKIRISDFQLWIFALEVKKRDFQLLIIEFSRQKFQIFSLQISAQESRRKKKEFVDTLEKRVELAVQELEEYKKKCELLQKQNVSLKSQLKSLKTTLATNNNATIKQEPDGNTKTT